MLIKENHSIDIDAYSMGALLVPDIIGITADSDFINPTCWHTNIYNYGAGNVIVTK